MALAAGGLCEARTPFHLHIRGQTELTSPRSLSCPNGSHTPFCRPRCGDLTQKTALGPQKVPARLTPSQVGGGWGL